MVLELVIIKARKICLWNGGGGGVVSVSHVKGGQF